MKGKQYTYVYRKDRDGTKQAKASYFYCSSRFRVANQISRISYRFRKQLIYLKKIERVCKGFPVLPHF